MKFQFIKSLVPAGEHFDESAIVNEGGWVSTNHLDAIDKTGSELQVQIAAFADVEAAHQVALDALTTANTAVVDGLNATIATMTDEATTSATTIATQTKTIETQTARITALEAEVKELGGESSGNGTTVVTEEEVVPKQVTVSKLPRYDSAEHPANQAADRYTRKKA